MGTASAERRKQLALTSVTGLALVGLILALVNIFSIWVFGRLDLTASRAYSLSSSSKKLVRSLDDLVVVKAYFTPDLPPPYNVYARYVKDMLAEYRSASHGRIRYEFVSPLPSQSFEQKAMEAGMSPIQFEEIGSSQFQVRRGFMGLVMFYHDRSEVLPVVKSVEGVEYDLTSRLAKLARRQKKVIAVTAGDDEQAWRTPQSKLYQELSELYEFREISLSSPTIPTFEADALLIAGPQKKMNDKALWAIDQAVMRGIPTAFLLDPAGEFIIGRFLMLPRASGVEEILKAYGIRLGEQLVYDAQCETVGMTQNVGGLVMTTGVRYAYLPLVNHFGADHPILKGLETVGIPFSVRLDPMSPLPNGVRFTPLFLSSPQSWLAPEKTYNVNPSAIPKPGAIDPQGPFVLGAILEGSFPSYFQGKSVPVKGQTLIPASPKTTLFVLGTSHIIDPSFPVMSGTEALMSNVLAYLTKDEVLLGIHSKGEVLRPLKPVSGAAQNAVKFGSVLGVPLLAIGWGLWRWRRREHWRLSLRAAFVPRPAKQ